MHHGFGINARSRIAQTTGGFVGAAPLFRRRQDERTASAESPDFLGEMIEGADSENHAGGGLVVEKRAHARPTISDRLHENRRVQCRFFLGDPWKPPIDPGDFTEDQEIRSRAALQEPA